MLIGQTIRANNGGTTVVYTPAFPRQGDGMTSVVEVFRLPADSTLTVQPQHVNSEDMELTTSSGWDDIGSSVSFSSEISASTVSDVETTGLKEVVRYKISLSESSEGSTFAHFRVLNPSWLTSGAQSI